MIGYIGSFILGSGLGANDSANVFGTAVGSRMVHYRTAAILTALFVFAGAAIQGAEGIHTLSGLTAQSSVTATATVFAAGITMIILTLLKLPTSASQAVVGAIIGVGFCTGNVEFKGLTKVILCWITTPIGALIFYIVFDFLFRKIINRFKLSIFFLDAILRAALILVGCYGAYALGANNVANVTGVFVGEGMLTPQQAALFGGISIAFGVLTFSKPVMLTVGKGIIQMDAFSAFIVVLSQAVTVHFYAMVGVPVSSSQAIIGAIIGISFVKGIHIIRFNILRNVICGWIATPITAGLLSYFFIKTTIFN